MEGYKSLAESFKSLTNLTSLQIDLMYALINRDLFENSLKLVKMLKLFLKHLPHSFKKKMYNRL